MPSTCAVPANRQAGRCLDARNDVGAALYIRLTLYLEPNWAVPWFHLGLLAKRQASWAACRRYNRCAVALSPDNEGAWWNLGIAATALRDWAQARAAWRACGFEVADGPGEVRYQIGPTPIRLNPEGEAEVVWCDRIDFARGLILNVPRAASGHRYRDLVLHDGAPNGQRLARGRSHPVFDELALLEPSGSHPFSAEVRLRVEADLDALIELASERHLAVEDWANLRQLGRTCSEGTPPEQQGAAVGQQAQLGVAAPGEWEARTLFLDWAAGRPGRELMELDHLLAPPN